MISKTSYALEYILKGHESKQDIMVRVLINKMHKLTICFIHNLFSLLLKSSWVEKDRVL